MDYAKYNRSLLDILQVLSKNPELKDVPDLEDWVDMGEMTYRSSPGTNMIYKKSGARLAGYSSRIFARDMTLLTGKDAEWPEMFSAWIPKVAGMPKTDQDYIWGKLADALTAIGQVPAPPPSKAVIAPPAAVTKTVTFDTKQKVVAPPVVEKAFSEDERRHLQFKQVIRENPEMRSTVRAVRDFVKAKSGGGAPGPELDALMAQLKTGSTSVESELTKAGLPQGLLSGHAGIFSKLTGLLKKMADSEEDGEEEEAPKQDPIGKEDEETQKIMQSLSMVQQFHVTFLKYYMHFAEFRGGQFPQLVSKYNALRVYLTAITKTTPKEFTLLNEVVQFFKDNKKAIRKHDPAVFEKPQHPLLIEMDSAKIWASLDKEEYREQFWNWVEEVRNISLAAHICTGDTAPFESIAKSVLPSICQSMKTNQEGGGGGAEGMMDRFMEAMQQPARIRSLKGLIDGFAKDPTQVTKAVDLITTMLDDGEDSESQAEDDGEGDDDRKASKADTKNLDISIG